MEFDYGFCMRNLCKTCKRYLVCIRKKYRLKPIQKNDKPLTYKPFEDLLKGRDSGGKKK